MATRMQQRRGTAAQWISTNSGNGPILNAGEIGYETDTNKFKIGDGTNHWINLDYFIDANSTVNPAFGSSITFEGATANDFETTLAITDPTADRTITFPDATGTVALTSDIAELSQDAIDTALTAGTGITKTYNDGTNTLTIAVDTATITTKTYVDNLVSNHATPTTNIHGIADTSLLATQTYANSAVTTHSNATEAHGATGAVVGTTNTQTLTNKTLTSPKINEDVVLTATATALNYVSGVTSSIQTQLDNKQNIDANVSSVEIGYLNGVTSDIQTQLNNKQAVVANVSDVEIGYLDGVTSAIQTQLNDKAPLASPTFTGTVTLPSGTVTSTMILDGTIANVDINASAAIDWTKLGISSTVSSTEIGYVDGVTSAIQTQLDAKAPLASPTFTGTVAAADLTLSGNLTVNGTTTTLNSTTMSVDDKNIELGSVAEPSDVTADGGGITLKGATDKTFNWVDATDSWTSSEHINLASGKDLKVNGTAVISSTAGGFIFTDGTQTLEGVPSRTPIVQKTASYALSELTERDSLIEVSSATGVTITIPTNTAVAYPIGTSIDILQTGAGQVTIAPVDGTVTVNATPGLKLRTTWSSCTLFKRAANTWVVFGDLTA